MEMAKAGYASQERIEEFRTEQVEMETYAQERLALYKHDEKLSENASLLGLLISVLVFAPLSPILCFLFFYLWMILLGMVWAIKTGVDFTTAINP